MTTNTTSTASQAPAVSIEKDEEFLNLLTRWTKHQDNTNADIMAGHIKWTELIAHIDAKLAQAREEGCTELRRQDHEQACHVTHALMTERDECKAAAEDFRHMAFLTTNASRKAEARATAAETKLEAIRQKLGGYVAASLYDEHGNDFYVADFAALLQPQLQSDESGLPG